MVTSMRWLHWLFFFFLHSATDANCLHAQPLSCGRLRGWACNTLNFCITAFDCKAIAQVAWGEGSLYPNNGSLTWTDYNHSQTDWQKSANNNSLIYKEKQNANTLQSIWASLQNESVMHLCKTQLIVFWLYFHIQVCWEPIPFYS